jgi:ubiquinone/menaquinone biosynthesis C-methylase UbiE
MFINPEQIIKSIGLSPGMQIADFGCGPGFYSIPAAKAVGAGGKVWALDVQKSMLELVRAKAKLERLLNVSALWADLEIKGGSQLADETVDAVIISNILFQTKNKKIMLEEAFRILKPGGRVAVIDWSSSAGSAGPRPEMIIMKEETEKLLTEIGFKPEKEFYAGDNHYGLLYAKP